MTISPFTGKPAQTAMLVNVPRLVAAYYTETPDASVPEQRVAFGTSGHRGSAFAKAFDERHILAISQATCLHREYLQDLCGELSRSGSLEEARIIVNHALAASPQRPRIPFEPKLKEKP